MDLGEPENIEPPAVGGLDLLEALIKRVGVALALHLAMKFMIPAEFHFRSFGTAPSALALDPICQPRPAAAIAQIPMFDPLP